MKSMIEFSKEKRKSTGRAGSTADKIIFSSYKNRDNGTIRYIVFYFGKSVLKKMEVSKGDKINAFMEDDSYQITFTFDPNDGKTVNIHKNGRGTLAIKYCKGLPYPTNKGVDMVNLSVVSGEAVAWLPEEGINYE